MSAAFGPTMRDSGWGRIVNLGSSITHSRTRDLLSYITSKGAVHALTRAFDNELGGSGVTVNAIAPSFIQTEGVRSRTTDVDGMTTEEEQALLLSLQTIERPQNPTDIANLLSFLVSDQADFITGQILHASGGLVRAGA